MQVRSSIFEIIKENELDDDDWLTLINPAFPFQSIYYFKALQTKICTENFDYIYPRVELVDQFFGIEEPNELDLANGNNCRHKESGLFKSIKVCRILDLKRDLLDSVGYLDVSSSDDEEISRICVQSTLDCMILLLQGEKIILRG